MATKPAITPVQWDSTDTNMTTPSAGQQSTGAATNAILASGIFNYLMRWLTAWTIYLADGIIQHAELSIYIPGCGGLGVAAGSDNTVAVTSGGSTSGFWQAGGAETYQVPIVLPVGERLKAIAARIEGTVSDTITMRVWSIDPEAGTPGTQLGTNQTSATTATRQTLTVSGLTTAIATDRVYLVEFTATGTNLRVHWTKITYDRVTS